MLTMIPLFLSWSVPRNQATSSPRGAAFVEAPVTALRATRAEWWASSTGRIGVGQTIEIRFSLWQGKTKTG